MKIILSFHENNSLTESRLYDHTLRNIDELLLFFLCYLRLQRLYDIAKEIIKVVKAILL